MLDKETRKRLKREHYDKYEALAQKMGIRALINIVPFEKQELINAYADDEHFNNLRLRQWDAMQSWVMITAVQPMSLCDCVCVLKHVARYHIVGADIPE